MGINFLKIAVIYFIIGIGFGMFMSISHKFEYASVHAHLNLVGWASFALAGLIYHLFPSLAENALGKLHFWLANIGLPIMLISLIILVAGNKSAESFIGIGASILTLGILSFVINVLKNLKAEEPKTEKQAAQ